MKSNDSAAFQLIPVLSQAVKQSGIAVVFAGVLGFAVNRVYDDLGQRNEVLVEMAREQVSSSKAVADSLRALSVQMDKTGATVDRLERQFVRNP